jgi:hypothetical protein
LPRTARKLVTLFPAKAAALALLAFGAILAAPLPDRGGPTAAGSETNPPPERLSRNDLLRMQQSIRESRRAAGADPTFARDRRLFGHGDPVGQSGAECGFSVSVSGDTAVVGVPQDDTAGGADTGSAYVFVRSGATWTEHQKLLAPDAAAGDVFG